jgi:DNA-binding NtrC family response regulator
VQARGSVIQPEDLPAMETPDHDRLGSGSMDDDLAHATRTWLKTHSVEMGVGEPSETVNAGFLYDQFLSVSEKALIQGVLEECGGNRAAVAARLGIHRTTLRQKMKRYGL